MENTKRYPRKVLTEAQKKIRDAEMAEIEKVLGKEAREAMEEYLTLFSDGFYIWLARLYDNETGALYYSNSGRDHEGFLPDLESTPRGYGWLISAGLCDGCERDLAKALPEETVKLVGEWTRGLQSSEDGYFYHPQWGKNIRPSRLGRDLSNAVIFLDGLHIKPLYDTPCGRVGELGAPSMITQNSDTGKASVLPEYLCDTEKFREYLAGFDWDNVSYSSANTLESQYSQILSAGDEFVKTFEDYMNYRQEIMQERLRSEAEEKLRAEKPDATDEEIAAARSVAENGLWEARLRYHSVNGLMKVCSTYSRLGIKLHYIKQAFESALSLVTLMEPDYTGVTANAIVNVFNPWVSIHHLLDNAEKFGDPETAETLRAKLIERAPELIRATMLKVSAFEKEDGSYGYCSFGVPALSQMAPVAVEGTNEGDVNGGTIATTGILAHMCAALGVKMPHLYFPEDLQVFRRELETAKPIVKKPQPAKNR